MNWRVMGKYRIAELNVMVEAEGERLLRQMKPYESCFAGEPQISLALSKADRASRIVCCDTMSAEEWEYCLTGDRFLEQLIVKRYGIILHASAILVDGNEYLFSAKSGTGKSTHTQLWMRYLDGNARILNDDKPALRCLNGHMYAYGTPWSGTSPLNVNERGNLKGIAYLSRAKENRIEEVHGAEAVRLILDNMLRPISSEHLSYVLEFIAQMLKEVPVYRLECNMDLAAAELAYSVMKK